MTTEKKRRPCERSAAIAVLKKLSFLQKQESITVAFCKWLKEVDPRLLPLGWRQRKRTSLRGTKQSRSLSGVVVAELALRSVRRRHPGAKRRILLCRHSGNVLSRGEKSPVFGRVKNASHSPGRPADFIQSIGPPLRNPEQWHFVYDSKKWIPDYCLWDDDREKKPSFRKCSVWNPEKPLDTSFRWYDDTKKSAVHLELTT